MSGGPMDLVLALHSHLPYVLNHGRWPHGSDWLAEAAIDSYLPLLEALERLELGGVPAPLTVGITPILASQLASPVFRDELEAYFAQRLATCDEAGASLRATGDDPLLPLAGFWRDRLTALRDRFRRVDGDLARAFRRQAERGTIELISSGATHAFLPLLARDESIRLQLGLGRAEHRRLFGRDPAGLWLPECAYRPRGPWAPLPDAPRMGIRRGIEEHVADAGYRYFFCDSHMAAAGEPFTTYGAGHALVPAETLEASGQAAARDRPPRNSPYQAYRVGSPYRRAGVAALVRDPRASRQVWSRYEGYPGDEWYLEFHKIRWPGGLKYWRVSPPGADLGAKLPYQPERAQEQARRHAAHFVSLLERIAVEHGPEAGPGAVIAVPFDTELFGHWWFEGVDFLTEVYRALVREGPIRPVTAGAHLADHPPARGLRLTTGSWGADGDFSMWLNPATAWTWRRLWAIEAGFWDAAPRALQAPALRPVLAQAAREMLLAMASDWQFIMSTGAVTDYAVRRFAGHADGAEFLIGALAPGAAHLAAAQHRAEELWLEDRVFPDVLEAVHAALAGSSTLAV